MKNRSSLWDCFLFRFIQGAFVDASTCLDVTWLSQDVWTYMFWGRNGQCYLFYSMYAWVGSPYSSCDKGKATTTKHCYPQPWHRHKNILSLKSVDFGKFFPRWSMHVSVRSMLSFLGPAENAWLGSVGFHFFVAYMGKGMCPHVSIYTKKIYMLSIVMFGWWFSPPCSTLRWWNN